MAERSKDDERFEFKNVQLFKDQSLGVGSYGAVCKAKCDDLLCAAKIIHPTLFDPTALHQIAPQREHRLPIRRFEQECEFMSAIRHLNIVQYLGMCRDVETHLPVLLMELMDDSLTHFLESSQQPIPYHIQVNICHDITLALSFLHSNNIVHRDLSSNNVLLRCNMLAKVTDFGMARLDDINPQATRFTNTKCPGTEVFMPPEAVQDKPVYSEKVDCFSFGVITVQILTKKFPKPDDRLQEVEFSHPGLPAGTVLVRIPEVTRRQNHLSEIDSDHPLRPVILDCLKDKDNERPSAHQVCQRLADLKGMPKFIESARAIQDKDETIRSLSEEIQRLREQLLQENSRFTKQLEERERQLNQELSQMQQVFRSKEVENQHLREQHQQANSRAARQLEERERQLNQELRQVNQQLRRVHYEKGRQLEERERQLGRVNQQLETAELVVAQFEKRVTELEQQLSQREQQNPESSIRVKKLPSFKLRWRKGKRAPCAIGRDTDAVVDGNMVYLRNRNTEKVYSCDVTTGRWSQLPNCTRKTCSLTIINGWLTTVGDGKLSNELFSLTGKGKERQWTKKFPPMPTKRQLTTSLCTGTALIVAGGWGVGGILSTIEVMNTETLQWSTADDLPQPMYFTSATVCGDCIYMLGGRDAPWSPIKSVYTCSVSALIQSCVPSSLEAKVERTSLVDKDSVWRQVADLPVTHSTCESFHGRLLVIGGRDDSGKPTTGLRMYNSTTNSWEIISHMTTERYNCFTAVLPNNQLMVVGGVSGERTVDTVEVAINLYSF